MLKVWENSDDYINLIETLSLQGNLGINPIDLGSYTLDNYLEAAGSESPIERHRKLIEKLLQNGEIKEQFKSTRVNIKLPDDEVMASEADSAFKMMYIAKKKDGKLCCVLSTFRRVQVETDNKHDFGGLRNPESLVKTGKIDITNLGRQQIREKCIDLFQDSNDDIKDYMEKIKPPHLSNILFIKTNLNECNEILFITKLKAWIKTKYIAGDEKKKTLINKIEKREKFLKKKIRFESTKIIQLYHALQIRKKETFEAEKQEVLGIKKNYDDNSSINKEDKEQLNNLYETKPTLLKEIGLFKNETDESKNIGTFIQIPVQQNGEIIQGTLVLDRILNPGEAILYIPNSLFARKVDDDDDDDPTPPMPRRSWSQLTIPPSNSLLTLGEYLRSIVHDRKKSRIAEEDKLMEMGAVEKAEEKAAEKAEEMVETIAAAAAMAAEGMVVAATGEVVKEEKKSEPFDIKKDVYNIIEESDVHMKFEALKQQVESQSQQFDPLEQIFAIDTGAPFPIKRPHVSGNLHSWMELYGTGSEKILTESYPILPEYNSDACTINILNAEKGGENFFYLQVIEPKIENINGKQTLKLLITFFKLDKDGNIIKAESKDSKQISSDKFEPTVNSLSRYVGEETEDKKMKPEYAIISKFADDRLPIMAFIHHIINGGSEYDFFTGTHDQWRTRDVLLPCFYDNVNKYYRYHLIQTILISNSLGHYNLAAVMKLQDPITIKKAQEMIAQKATLNEKKKKLEEHIKTKLDQDQKHNTETHDEKINQIRRLINVKNDIDRDIIIEPVIDKKELKGYNILVKKIKDIFGKLKEPTPGTKRKSSALDAYNEISELVKKLEHNPAKKQNTLPAAASMGMLYSGPVTASTFTDDPMGSDARGSEGKGKTKRRRRRFKPKKIANQTIKQIKRITKRLKNKLIEKGRKTIKRFRKAKAETKKKRPKNLNMYCKNAKPIKNTKNVRKFMKTLRPILFVKRLQNKATTRKNKDKDKRKKKNSKS